MLNFMKEVKHIKITKDMKVSDLIREMSSSGVMQAGKLALSVNILEEMIKDKECKVFFGLAGAMVPGGMKNIIIDMIDNKLIDVFVTTGANLTHDLVEGLGHCAMCHTPVNLIGGPIHSYHLTGNFIEGFWAPNITAEGLSRSDVNEVVEVFSKGRLSLGAGAVAGTVVVGKGTGGLVGWIKVDTLVFSGATPQPASARSSWPRRWCSDSDRSCPRCRSDSSLPG